MNSLKNILGACSLGLGIECLRRSLAYTQHVALQAPFCKLFFECAHSLQSAMNYGIMHHFKRPLRVVEVDMDFESAQWNATLQECRWNTAAASWGVDKIYMVASLVLLVGSSAYLITKGIQAYRSKTQPPRPAPVSRKTVVWPLERRPLPEPVKLTPVSTLPELPIVSEMTAEERWRLEQERISRRVAHSARAY